MIPTEQYERLRNELIEIRNECLGIEFDPNGAVILSHAIKWFYCKLNNLPYKAED